MPSDRRWLESRLNAHQRYLFLLAAAIAVSLIGAALLFSVMMPWVAARLPLPPELTTVLVLGIGAELLTLLVMTYRVDTRRRQLRRDLDQASQH